MQAAAVVASGVAQQKTWVPTFQSKLISSATEEYLIADVLLPAQMHTLRGTRERPGEQRLLLAIVHQAWVDLHGPNPVLRDEAWVWFTGKPDGYIGNFANICDVFDWDRSWALRRLYASRNRPPTFLVRRMK